VAACCARHGGPGGEGEAEGGGDPQHIPLAEVFAELPQVGAIAIYLVSADEIEGGALSQCTGQDVDRELPLRAEHQITGKAHHQ
jgi:hypothetical protein